VLTTELLLGAEAGVLSLGMNGRRTQILVVVLCLHVGMLMGYFLYGV